MNVNRAVLRERLGRVPGLVSFIRMVLGTIRICMRYRVTGLAAEAGFFALLSLPPLIYGLLGAVGYVGEWLGQDVVARVTMSIERYASQFLTEQSLRNVLLPTLKEALSGGRFDIISIGFLLSLWSGSRALNVLLDTISIMYGQGGRRGIVRTRVLSLSLYFVSLLFGALVFPLIVIGPELISSWLPPKFLFLMNFYWPLVGGLTILAFATLYYIATPRRMPWVRALPGAALTLAIWVVSSMALRFFLGASVDGVSIYGPLAATIVVLIWLYFLGIAVLIGAAFNASAARIWPLRELTSLGDRARGWLDARNAEREPVAARLPGRRASSIRSRKETPTERELPGEVPHASPADESADAASGAATETPTVPVVSPSKP